MKKFFYMSVLVLMAALTLTSCGSDDDGKDEPKPSTKTVNYEASVTLSQDLIDLCNVTLTYKDGDGKTVTENVTSTTWSKKFAVKTLPAVVGVKCDYKMKEGVQLTKEKYDIIATLNHYLTIDGAKKGFDQPFIYTQSQGLRADKVAEILGKTSGRMYGYNISANGEVTTTENITF